MSGRKRWGSGSGDEKEIRILGNSVAEVFRPFKRACAPLKIDAKKIDFIDGQACNACRDGLRIALERLQASGVDLDKLPELKISLGSKASSGGFGRLRPDAHRKLSEPVQAPPQLRPRLSAPYLSHGGRDSGDAGRKKEIRAEEKTSSWIDSVDNFGGNRPSGENRSPEYFKAFEACWIPAFAGITETGISYRF